MEKQKFQIADIVYNISSFENVEAPYIEKGKVMGVSLGEGGKLKYSVSLYQKQNKKYYFTNKPKDFLSKELYDNYETPMKRVEKILDKENKKRKLDFRRRLKELEIN